MKTLTIRLSPEDWTRVKVLAAEAGMTVKALFLRSILPATPVIVDRARSSTIPPAGSPLVTEPPSSIGPAGPQQPPSHESKTKTQQQTSWEEYQARQAKAKLGQTQANKRRK